MLKTERLDHPHPHDLQSLSGLHLYRHDSVQHEHRFKVKLMDGVLVKQEVVHALASRPQVALFLTGYQKRDVVSDLVPVPTFWRAFAV